MRVLKAQLDLHRRSRAHDALHVAVLGAGAAPGWARTFSACSAIVRFNQAVLLPCVVAGDDVSRLGRLASTSTTTARQTITNRAQPWFRACRSCRRSSAPAWGLMPWLCGIPASQLNHMFLAGAMMAVMARLVVSRASHMDMFLASLAAADAVAGAAVLFGRFPRRLWHGPSALPLRRSRCFYDGRRLVHRLDEDARLRFQVEDLARELEETRDDALRKRFEAETANASKTAFLANMSHELRTPLNAILGFSEIIAQECFGPVGSARYKEYAGDIHSSGAHLLSLINDLLDVAKIEAGKMEIAPHPLDAHRTFDIALKLIGAKAREKEQTLDHRGRSRRAAALRRRTRPQADPDQSGVPMR